LRDRSQQWRRAGAVGGIDVRPCSDPVAWSTSAPAACAPAGALQRRDSVRGINLPVDDNRARVVRRCSDERCTGDGDSHPTVRSRRHRGVSWLLLPSGTVGEHARNNRAVVGCDGAMQWRTQHQIHGRAQRRRCADSVRSLRHNGDGQRRVTARHHQQHRRQQPQQHDRQQRHPRRTSRAQPAACAAAAARPLRGRAGAPFRTTP